MFRLSPLLTPHLNPLHPSPLSQFHPRIHSHLNLNPFTNDHDHSSSHHYPLFRLPQSYFNPILILYVTLTHTHPIPIPNLTRTLRGWICLIHRLLSSNSERICGLDDSNARLLDRGNKTCLLAQCGLSSLRDYWTRRLPLYFPWTETSLPIAWHSGPLSWV